MTSRRPAHRLAQAGLAVAVSLGVFLVGVTAGSDTPPVLPDTDEQFSLDLEVVATAEASVVYVVEQRARPAYRIFAFDPATGTDETVFTVPEDAIIYGIDLDTTGATLAVTYTPDHELDGSGLWTLDLATGAFEMVSPVREDVYLTDPEWSDDGTTVYATLVDRTGEEEALEVIAVSADDGQQTTVATDAVDPAASGGLVHYLAVDDETSARRSVRVVDTTTGEDRAVADGGLDLDHLMTGDDAGAITVAAIETEDAGTLTLGSPAQAHGNHDVPSTWWDVTTYAPYDFASTIVYDADLSGDALVYVTREGLSIADGTKVDLIESRALRFVTG